MSQPANLNPFRGTNCIIIRRKKTVEENICVLFKLTSLPLQAVVSVGSVKQAFITAKSDVSVVHVVVSHFPANTSGNVDAPP